MHTSSNPPAPTDLGGLFKHASRPEWGLATCVANAAAHRSFQFQDGKLRKIGLGFLRLLTQVDRPLDESEHIQNELAAKAGLTLSRRNARQAGATLYTVAQQAQLFRTDFPEGFGGAEFVKKHRGTSSKQTAKRHRDAAIERAKGLLGRTELLQLMASGRQDVVMERVAELLSSTSLATKRQLEPLHALDADGQRRAASALCELLYGDVDLAMAMQRWINALAVGRRGVSWQLATVPLGLVHPTKHLCVAHTTIVQQARWLAPDLEPKREPTGKLYVRLLQLGRRLVNELEALDLHPRDLLDVHDFMAHTLRPAARKRIDAMPVKLETVAPADLPDLAAA
jgi:hypothetical protein